MGNRVDRPFGDPGRRDDFSVGVNKPAAHDLLTWTPLNLPNAVNYWDGRLGVSTSGINVSSWECQLSGDTISRTPSTALQVSTASFGGQQALDFDGGGSDFFGSRTTTTSSGDLGLFFVIDADTTSGAQSLCRLDVDTGELRIGYNPYNYRFTNGSAVTDNYGVETNIGGEQSLLYNLTATDSSTFQRNGGDLTPASTDWDGRTLVAANTWIGSRAAGSPFDGRIAVVIINDGAFTAGELAQLNAWASSVWGI